MKKIILTILLCLLIIVKLTGCVNKKNNFEIGEESNIEITEKEVSLSIKESTLTNTGATLILKNESNSDVEYGNTYEIEIKKNDKWYKINVVLNFTLPSFILKSNEIKEIKLDWKNYYGVLTKGNYRIIKVFNIKQEDETFDTFYVSAEFTID